MEEFVKEFKKLQGIMERLKENVESKLSEKDECIYQLQNQIHQLYKELQKLKRENEVLRTTESNNTNQI